MKKIIGYFLVGILSACSAVFIVDYFNLKRTTIIRENDSTPVKLANYNGPTQNDGFIQAAKISTPAVVHINTVIKAKKISKKEMQQQINPFYQFFGDPFGNSPYGMPQQQDQEASGSGVIISNDGYIVTNNHVVDGADEINVNLYDNRVFKAKLIGTDPNTDLAVIKIDTKDLQYLTFANSDNVEVGQWVLAVGNPFNLASTVTAGIVSAKTRNINILREKAGNLAIESFIQTDAAVNQGNSGGALVNTDGKLVGINSAIASPTGYYSGYSYAIPVNIVKKIIGDLTKYGAVQRAYLGITYPDENLSDEQKKEIGIKEGNGVFVSDVTDGGAAKEAGIKKGDFITSPEISQMFGEVKQKANRR